MSSLLEDQTLWYLSRATGLVCLALLTITLVLGIIATNRVATDNWPRFVTQGLHRNISLFVLVLLGVHIVTVVMDDYVRIGLVDAVVPFVSEYRPIWLGLGTLAFDLMIVMIITSLARQRIGYELWRVVHWLAYASWPLSVVHGLGTGSDARRTWVGWFTVLCVVVVLLAVSWRIVAGWPERALVRLGAAAAAVSLLAVVFAWAQQGPLAPGWSKRAGTPVPSTSGNTK